MTGNTKPSPSKSGRLPGDPSPDELRQRMIRINHAGEYGAVRIYAGQLAVFGKTHRLSRVVRRMEHQEQRHLKVFDDLMIENRVRPTALAPLWHVAGFALGAATALMGEKAAMACTSAVEEVIEEHYTAQLEVLGENDRALSETVREFRADEVAHKQEALDHGAAETPGYTVLSGLIKGGCRAAIWLSQRL